MRLNPIQAVRPDAIRRAHTQEGLLYPRGDGSSYLQTPGKFLEIVADSPKMKKDLEKAAAKSQGRSMMAVVEGRVKKLGDREVFMATGIRSASIATGYSGVVKAVPGKAGQLSLTNTQGTYTLKPMTKEARESFKGGLTNYNPPPVFLGQRRGKTIEVWSVVLAMHTRPGLGPVPR